MKMILKLTLTDCTAPNGPNSCQRTFSSVSGAKLYTKIHQPDPLMGLVDNIELAKMSFVSDEYLEDAKLYLSIVNVSFMVDHDFSYSESKMYLKRPVA